MLIITIITTLIYFLPLIGLLLISLVFWKLEYFGKKNIASIIIYLSLVLLLFTVISASIYLAKEGTLLLIN